MRSLSASDASEPQNPSRPRRRHRKLKRATFRCRGRAALSPPTSDSPTRVCETSATKVPARRAEPAPAPGCQNRHFQTELPLIITSVVGVGRTLPHGRCPRQPQMCCDRPEKEGRRRRGSPVASDILSTKTGCSVKGHRADQTRLSVSVSAPRYCAARQATAVFETSADVFHSFYLNIRVLSL